MSSPTNRRRSLISIVYNSENSLWKIEIDGYFSGQSSASNENVSFFLFYSWFLHKSFNPLRCVDSSEHVKRQSCRGSSAAAFLYGGSWYQSTQRRCDTTETCWESTSFKVRHFHSPTNPWSNGGSIGDSNHRHPNASACVDCLHHSQSTLLPVEDLPTRLRQHDTPWFIRKYNRPSFLPTF